MANSFYLDASALAKRYLPKKGSAQVDAILDGVAADRIYVLNAGAGEVISILVRKRNAGIIGSADFDEASGWHALRYSEGRAGGTTPFGVPQGVPPDANHGYRAPS